MSETDAILRQGLARHQAGDLPAAGLLYEDVLRRRPGDADALHLLGVLRAAQGAVADGIGLIRAALARHPDFATAHFNLGNLLAQHGDPAAALDSLAACLRLAPAHAAARAAIGRTLLALGRMEEAAAALRQAIADGGDAGLWNDLGIALQGTGKLAEAIDAYASAVRLAPDLTVAQRNLGFALLGAGRGHEATVALQAAFDRDPGQADAGHHLAAMRAGHGDRAGALALLDQVLRHAPDHRPARLMRGGLLCETGRHAEAHADFAAVLARHPDDAAALAGRGDAHWALLDLDAAEADLARALHLAPDHVPALIDRGNVRQDRGDFQGALADYDRALSLDPGNRSALTNRGASLQALHRYPEALAAYDTMLAADPDDAASRLSRALCRLRMGDWPGGWTDFEARWTLPRWRASLAGLDAPRWDGQADLAGRRVLVLGEQGLGDMIQFARFAPRLAARGATVILGVEAPLRRLMASLDGVAEVVVGGDSVHFDTYTLIMSLPHLLGLPEAGLAMPAPYLRAEPDAIAAWRARLAPLPGLKVGLAWAGDPRPGDRQAHQIDRRRSVPLARLAPLLATPNVTFVSLQKGQGAAEAAEHGLLDWTGDLADYADTAALMMALDLIVSVDTSVVHAAGALGRPVWMLNRYDCCWRWRFGQGDTIWYPTMRLFTQTTPNDWDGVARATAAALTDLA